MMSLSEAMETQRLLAVVRTTRSLSRTYGDKARHLVRLGLSLSTNTL